MSVCSHCRGYPIPGLGGTPSQVWWLGGTPSQVWLGGYPIPGLAGGYQSTPLTRSGWGTPSLDLGQGTSLDLRWGTPPSPQTWDGVPPDLDRVPLPWTWTGYPQTWHRVPPQTWDGVPPQQSKHLIYGGQYASCVHAGGLSCFKCVTTLKCIP